MLRSDAELLDAIRHDDQSAWNEFVRRHTHRVWAAAKAQVHDDHLASDVVQSVWVELIRRLDSIRKDESIRYWLVTVAHHEAIRHSKQQRRMGLDSDVGLKADSGANADHGRVEEADQIAMLRRAFAELSEQCRALLALLFSGAGLSYEEIAARVDRPVGSIGPTRERCLDRLRERFGRVTR